MNDMNDEIKTSNPVPVSSPDTAPDRVELTAMELNNIKLDAKHTLLTPNYLDNLETTS